eukprot:COSAG06_NODE_966_length_11290_cov_4.010097_10_plen_364_part_00
MLFATRVLDGGLQEHISNRGRSTTPKEQENLTTATRVALPSCCGAGQPWGDQHAIALCKFQTRAKLHACTARPGAAAEMRAALRPMRLLPPLPLLAAAQQLLLGLASAGHHFPGATMCCNWRAQPLECGVGVCSQSDGCSWLCHEQCKCPEPGWMPTSWAAEIASGDLLPAAPDNPGGAIANGYLGAWVPRGLPGSAGAAVCGVEHVKGVFSPQSTPRRLSPDSGAKNESYNVILTPLASWTATSFLASIGAAKLPATASAMDFRNGAYRVASQAGDVNCVQTIYAHRAQPHLLISEFRCENNGETETTVTIDEGRCNPLKPVDLYIYETLCPQPVRNTFIPTFALAIMPKQEQFNSIVRSLI